MLKHGYIHEILKYYYQILGHIEIKYFYKTIFATKWVRLIIFCKKKINGNPNDK